MFEATFYELKEKTKLTKRGRGNVGRRDRGQLNPVRTGPKCIGGTTVTTTFDMKGLICLFTRPYLPLHPPASVQSFSLLPKGTSTEHQITDGKEDLTRAAFVPLMADLPSGLGAMSGKIKRSTGQPQYFFERNIIS